MNLKETFRYQNKLQELTEEAVEILRFDRNVTVTTNTHLRKKVMPEAENETVIEMPDTEYADSITRLVLKSDLIQWLNLHKNTTFRDLR